MSARCADLDEFFDGELTDDQAAAFRDHLGTCERCQAVLLGRMQEGIAAQSPAPIAVPAQRSRARRRSRMVAYAAAPVLATAAGMALWLGHGREAGFALSLAIDQGEQARGGPAAAPRPRVASGHHSAHVGDTVRPRAHGEPYQAIWIYLDERELVAACPRDGARCSTAGDELALELRLSTRGQYTIVALGSRDPLPEPGATADEAIAVARSSGMQREVKYVNVD